MALPLYKESGLPESSADQSFFEKGCTALIEVEEKRAYFQKLCWILFPHMTVGQSEVQATVKFTMVTHVT